ncbi:DNA polymerase epsilon subunit 2 isoform X2 [Rhipicephalus microplus]|uniref:DNA polymerase epsilon subunit 2 isoform X2 n=1 Tax=Rhipicephalus microplus TaxID=6941 RepID=UPI001887B2B9|nr:DNA polymerase epsilon subunit 2-like isoform X2 [Rhipicephalus microplus]
MSGKVRSKIIKSFQIRGFTLRSEASKFLLEALTPLDEDRQDLWLKRLLDLLQVQRIDGPFLTKDDILGCIREFERSDSDGTDVRLLVADAFALAPLTYCQERRKFVPRELVGHGGPPRLFGDAGAKAFFFRERYQLVLQKTARHHCFSSRSRLPTASGFDLRPIEHLLGTTGECVVVLGMLCQLEEGNYFLEDTTGSVKIDISGTKFTADLFVDNSFVLAEGCYEDMAFRVDAMGLPPIEPALEAMKYMGGASIFDKFPEKLRTQLELSDVPDNALFVLLSDVWLDQPQVLSHLRVLFSGFAQGAPACFVLAGNFLSRSTGLQKDRVLLREGFKALAEMLHEFPLLIKHSRFIFVPGPRDPGLSNVLPRPGLPYQVTEPLRSCGGNEAESTLAERCHWVSNPCRLLYCGRQVVLWRQDGLAKACRNAVHRPWDKTGLDLAQAGSFPKADYVFKVYYPAFKKVEDSQIGND